MRLTEPSRHRLVSSSRRARARLFPCTFGTTHSRWTIAGPPPIRPHQTPQRPEPAPAPTGARAYSWSVQSERSSEGSTWLLL